LASWLMGATQPIHAVGYLIWVALGAFVGLLMSLQRHRMYRIAIFVGFNIVWVILSVIAIFLSVSLPPYKQ